MKMKELPVGKKTGGDATGKTTVKVDVELHRKARTIASYNGLELTDYLDGLLRPIIEKAYAEMGRKIQREGDKDD